jgi:hypothetical protein
MKRLGEYLIENDICDESLLDNALQEQAQLQSKGIFKPLGSVLIDSHDVSQQDIDKAISLMHLNVLSTSGFRTFQRKHCWKHLTERSFGLYQKTVLFSARERNRKIFSLSFPVQSRYSRPQVMARKASSPL